MRPLESTVVETVITAAGERRATVIDVIRRAQRTLVLSLFRCNDDQIFEELEGAVDRGVHVRVLMTGRARGGPAKLEKLRTSLERTGADVSAYRDPVVKYHAKYIVADQGPAIVASLNFTRKCFNKTCDALVVTDDADVVASLLRLFEADSDGRPVPEDLSPRLIIGPERARRQFTALISNAERTIRLIDPKLSDPELVTLLNARHASGVSVEVVASRTIGGMKSHGKIMLIDNCTAVIGSLALAALSLEFRREVAIIVEHPPAVAEVEQLFNQIPIAGSFAGKGEALC